MRALSSFLTVVVGAYLDFGHLHLEGRLFLQTVFYGIFRLLLASKRSLTLRRTLFGKLGWFLTSKMGLFFRKSDG